MQWSRKFLGYCDFGKFVFILKFQNAELLEDQIFKPPFGKLEIRLYLYDMVQKLAELVKIPLNVGFL